jgi:hypothetical protein
MRILFISCLFFCIQAKGQDTVLHFNTPTKIYLMNTVHPLWLDSIAKYHHDFLPVQLKDSSWYLNKQNLYNPCFQGLIKYIKQGHWIDSIDYEPINDTMYIIRHL